jgi:hypothetical protein
VLWLIEYENAKFLYDHYTIDPCQMLELHIEGRWEEGINMLDKLNLWNKIGLREFGNAFTHICSHNKINWLDMPVLNTEVCYKY